MKIYSRLTLLTALLFMFGGCTANRPFRANLPVYPGANTDRPSSLPPINPTNAFTIETNTVGIETDTPTAKASAAFKIGYVEFDDQGWFWAHKQWEAVKTELTTEASNSPAGLTIIVFVHGWKNNADSDCGNVNTFRQVLTNLSTSLNPRKVFGVYVGWRGLSIKSDYFPIPFGEEMTFYHRKDVAERIGHQGAATQVFTELEIMQDELNSRTNQLGVLNTQPNRTELIIIGHSFGGQLVYSAISQVLIERLVMASRPGHRGKERVRSLGDLVILLNPAFEASLYNNIISLADSTDILYPPDQAPVLAILTSESDWATGLAFPAGRHLSSWFENTRPSHGPKEHWLFNLEKHDTKDEHSAIMEAIGHDKDYLNYDLTFTNYGTNTFVAAALPGVAPARISLHATLVANNAAPSTFDKAPLIFTNSIHGTNYACVLQALTSYTNTSVTNFNSSSPFLNVAVDPNIMNGHNDIANPVLLNFLHDFIQFNRTNYLKANPRYSEQTFK